MKRNLKGTSKTVKLLSEMTIEERLSALVAILQLIHEQKQKQAKKGGDPSLGRANTPSQAMSGR